MTTYERFCREAYNLLKKNIKADNGVPSEEVEKFLKRSLTILSSIFTAEWQRQMSLTISLTRTEAADFWTMMW